MQSFSQQVFTCDVWCSDVEFLPQIPTLSWNISVTEFICNEILVCRTRNLPTTWVFLTNKEIPRKSVLLLSERHSSRASTGNTSWPLSPMFRHLQFNLTYLDPLLCLFFIFQALLEVIWKPEQLIHLKNKINWFLHHLQKHRKYETLMEQSSTAADLQPAIRYCGTIIFLILIWG